MAHTLAAGAELYRCVADTLEAEEEVPYCRAGDRPAAEVVLGRAGRTLEAEAALLPWTVAGEPSRSHQAGA